MKAMKIKRYRALFREGWRELDGGKYGWVETQFGSVFVVYMNRAPVIHATFEMTIDLYRYSVTLNGKRATRRLVLGAEAFAGQCQRLHEKGGS